MLAGGPPLAVAAAEGTAVGVDPDAVARRGSADRTLVVGADISVGERIVTGPSGRVQVLFADQTRLVVGPGSALLIESYLMNGDAADKFAINALAGTFRFISGNSPKSAYSIETPTAAIAVRGTKFDVSVAGDATRVLLFEGALQLCHAGSCVELTERCELGSTGPGGSSQATWGDAGRGGFLGGFPLANVQSTLEPGFRVSGAQACLAPPPGNQPQNLADPGAESSSYSTNPPPPNPNSLLGN